MVLIALISSAFFVNKETQKTDKDPENLIIFSTLSEEFLNNYFEEYRAIEEEKKEVVEEEPKTSETKKVSFITILFIITTLCSVGYIIFMHKNMNTKKRN